MRLVWIFLVLQAVFRVEGRAVIPDSKPHAFFNVELDFYADILFVGIVLQDIESDFFQAKPYTRAGIRGNLVFL